MPKFRLGTDDFMKLITEGGYFVDKSLLIREVIQGSDVTLLPRPRRFGKTLNMTMLRYFFEKSDEDRRSIFDGLAVANNADCMEHQGRYPVIYLSLKDIKGNIWEEALVAIRSRLSSLYRDHKAASRFVPPEDQRRIESICTESADLGTMKLSLKNLISYLHKHHGKPVVVLIDDYDSPVIESWNKGYYDEMLDFIRAWLDAGLKHENGRALYRAVVTGILRIAKESIFSGLNNLDVPTLIRSGPFADKFGFTQAEVDQILVDFNLPELSEPMQTWYNGYNFGGEVIYNPWSVISCIHQHPDPVGPQWLNTASNDLVHAELEAGGLPLKRDLERLLKGEELRYPIVENTVFKNVGTRPETIWSFLVFSGYLKASDPCPDPLTGEQHYRLSIPNQEVSMAYREFVAHWHLQANFNATNEMLRSLVTDDIPHFERLFSELVCNLLSHHGTAKQPEAVYHALVLGLLANIRSAYQIRSNAESGYGRADILLQPLTDAFPLAFVIEFKAIAPDGDTDSAIAAALEQIESKAYEAQLVEAGVTSDNIRKLAIVFNGKQVTVRDLSDCDGTS